MTQYSWKYSTLFSLIVWVCALAYFVAVFSLLVVQNTGTVAQNEACKGYWQQETCVNEFLECTFFGVIVNDPKQLTMFVTSCLALLLFVAFFIWNMYLFANPWTDNSRVVQGAIPLTLNTAPGALGTDRLLA